MRYRMGLLCAFGLAAGGCGFLPFSRHSDEGVEVLERAAKPAPVDSMFEGCGPAGSQPDYAINRLKNRIDEGQYVPVPWSMIARLPWPRRVGYRFRNQWTSGERNEVNRFEGAAVQIEGYLVAYDLEPPEPPNCYDTDPAHRDFHLWLADAPDNRKKQSVIVEITPRIRVKHPGWTRERIGALVDSRVRVRIQGWLMLDQMHPESIGGVRATLWEVHPIMHVWWRAGERWISLDDSVAIR